jgi:hypothetical protein
VKDEEAPNGDLIIVLEAPYQGWSGPIEGFVVTKEGPDPYELDLDENGRSAWKSGDVKTILPKIPVYGGLGSQIHLSSGRGHRLTLRFHANDLGRAAFDNEPLSFSAGSLVLNRYERQIRFIREQH